MRLKGPALVAILPVLFGTALPVFAQSLAEVAKKEEDRRKTITAPAKVYTNQDLKPVPESSTPAPSSTASTPASGSTPDASAASSKEEKEGEKTKGPVKDKAYWSARMKGLQENLTRDEGYAEAMQTRFNSLTTDFVNRDDPIQRATIEQNRNKTRSEIERLKKAVADDKKAIDDLLEEARRAGVPPGWLR